MELKLRAAQENLQCQKAIPEFLIILKAFKLIFIILPFRIHLLMHHSIQPKLIQIVSTIKSR